MRFLVTVFSVLLPIALVAAGAFAYRPAIQPVARPDPAARPAAEVAKGAGLAHLGDCMVCHTAAGGIPFAGGRPLATPFGTLYATNLTPDEASGLGRWSPAAFRRAMREGVSRDGRHLYPALPYEHFSRMNDADLDALYAFLMSLPPVSASIPANRLVFPLGFRPLLAGWKLLFLHPEPIRPVEGQSAEWNRGRYLVEGLAHCGACHRPRNLAGAEKSGQPFAGGIAEGWTAPALTAANPSVHPWTADSLFTYLTAGVEARHSAAGGPMGPVVEELAQAPPTDVKAIAVYIASLLPRPDGLAVDRAAEAAAAHPAGARLFAGACAGCHENGAPMLRQGRPSLALAAALQAPDPRNALNAMLQGIALPPGRRGAYMPAFEASLDDGRIAELAAYLRMRFSTAPPWSDVEQAVAAARKEEPSE